MVDLRGLLPILPLGRWYVLSGSAAINKKLVLDRRLSL